MNNYGKRFTRFTNIHKMSNACASSFGRYIKLLNEWYTIYVTNFNFLFKSMFLRRNGRIEKNLKLIRNSSPRKTSHLPSSRISTTLKPPPVNFFKNRLLSNLKMGRHRKQSIVLYPEVFCTYLYIYVLCILDWKWRTPTMMGASC